MVRNTMHVARGIEAVIDSARQTDVAENCVWVNSSEVARAVRQAKKLSDGSAEVEILVDGRDDRVGLWL
jgi:hypothetical protein